MSPIPSGPLTYPARPVNGGQLKHALPKIGQWFYEPKYNGWRAMVHVPSGTMWNRHGTRLTIAREFKVALDILRRSSLEWADVEALERRHGLGCGSLIVLDSPAPPSWSPTPPLWSYDFRRTFLYSTLVATNLGECLIQTFKPEENTIYIAPSYGEAERDKLWQQLQDVNRCLGCIFYEGLVAKKTDSLYPLQLNSSEQTTATWMKHRFVR
jgi:hypothetical protein